MGAELFSIYSGTQNVYCTLIQEATSYIYDTTTSTYVVEDIADWTNYVIDMSSTNEDIYTVDFPTSANGWYKVVYRVKGVATGGIGDDASVSDIIISNARVYWSGRTVEPTAPEGVDPPTISDYAFVDLNTVKRFLDIDYLSTNKDYVLIDLINYITSRMEKIADRKFLARTYREQIFTNGQGNIIVKNWPVQTIYRIASATQTGMTLTHSGDELRVTVGSKSTDRANTTLGEGAIVIQSISSLGVLTITSFDLKTYPTLALLAAAINSVTNVTCVVNTNAPSLDLWEVTNVTFTNTNTTIDIISTDNIQYKLQADCGVIEIGVVPDWVIVEYRGGFENNSDGQGDEETEFYYNVNVCLDCISLVYNTIAQKTNLKSNQFDTGETLNIQSYFSAQEIDDFITNKIRVTGDFALAV